ncbi:MAG: hypothetical protein GX306_07230 [Clostridiales bacterium]|jgi:hypothetical protein|nr:hypothetical protein [Clostridiales bacterium]
MYDKPVSFITMVPLGCNLGFSFIKEEDSTKGFYKNATRWDRNTAYSDNLRDGLRCYNERNIAKYQ